MNTYKVWLEWQVPHEIYRRRKVVKIVREGPLMAIAAVAQELPREAHLVLIHAELWSRPEQDFPVPPLGETTTDSGPASG